MATRISLDLARKLGIDVPKASRFGNPRHCEIGGKRFYARSSWEANYAHYLEWQKVHGIIRDWVHEPRTYWFTEPVTVGKRRFKGLRRGRNSYKPDFSVVLNNGQEELHEVKGRMENRSRILIQRMRDRNPHIPLIVIGRDEYTRIKLEWSKLIDGWV